MKKLNRFQMFIRKVRDKKFWCKLGLHAWVITMEYSGEVIDLNREPTQEEIDKSACDRCGKLRRIK